MDKLADEDVARVIEDRTVGSYKLARLEVVAIVGGSNFASLLIAVLGIA